jgi:hypothetical protein
MRYTCWLGFRFVWAAGQLGGVFFGQQAMDELRFAVVVDGDDGAAVGYGVGVVGDRLLVVDGFDVLFYGFELVIQRIGFLV